MLTKLRDIHPYRILVEGVLICVEAFQGTLVSQVYSIHRDIVLMAEDDALARNAFSRGFGAPFADRFLLVTLQLLLAAGQTATMVSRGSIQELLHLPSEL